MPLASDPQYPSHASPPRYSQGTQVTVDGQFSGPVPGARPLPTALGGNIDLAGALEGSITDLRAASNELSQVASNINIMTQRINRMLGEHSAPGSSINQNFPSPNNVPGAEGIHGGREVSSVSALDYAMARSYGSSMSAGPRNFGPYSAPLLAPEPVRPLLHSTRAR